MHRDAGACVRLAAWTETETAALLHSLQVVQHRCPQMGAGCQVRQGTSNCNVVASDAFERVFRLSGLGVPAVTVDAKAPVVQLQEQPRQAVTAESSAGGGKRPVIAP